MNEDTLSQGFKYFAFISYTSADFKEAWGLKKKLDSYKLPSVLRKRYNKKRKPTCEAFLDKTNIQVGDLTDELRENLDSSHYLIVVCSPRVLDSDYVGEEIEWFTRNGRENELFTFIVECDKNDVKGSCYHDAIIEVEKRWSNRDGEERDILGANIKEKNVDQMFFLYRWPYVGQWLQRERAYMQLISKLLNLKFGEIWSYHKMLLIETVITYLFGFVLVISVIIYTWYINQPVDVKVRLDEVSVYNPNLPPLQDAVVTMALDNETKTDTIRSLGETTMFTNIPHRFLNHQVRVTVECRNFLPTDTVIPLSENACIDIQRNPDVFGQVHFTLWNPDIEQSSANTKVIVDGRPVMSDSDGYVSLTIPLAEQKSKYLVSSNSVNLVDTVVILPCGPNDIIQFK